MKKICMFCRGCGTVKGIGMMTMDCTHCAGTGFSPVVADEDKKNTGEKKKNTGEKKKSVSSHKNKSVSK